MISPPDAGYRYVYYHELFTNADFAASVYSYMTLTGADFAMLINGAVSQAQLFDSGYENGLNVLQVTEGYPVDPSAAREPLLEKAEIYIGDTLCARTGTAVEEKAWATFACGGDGATGDTITIKKSDDLPLSLCGIEVRGVPDEYIKAEEMK